MKRKQRWLNHVRKWLEIRARLGLSHEQSFRTALVYDVYCKVRDGKSPVPALWRG
jgi:hypothetical protein